MIFPRIEHIDDVLPHITDENGIFVFERPGMTVVDYFFTNDDTFSSPLACECRGLKFDESGRVIARPFHKFFNVGEREMPEQIAWDRPHRVFDKMDGSMIHPAMVAGELVFMTRKGTGGQSAAATQCVTADAEALCRSLLAAGVTPLFEYTSPGHRIVVTYDRPQLTLLAAREMASGAYMPFDEVKALGDRHSVPVVRSLGPVGDFKAFIKQSRALRGIEGFVIAFDDGHRVKLKTDAYALRHKALEGITNEKDVVAWVADRAVDDVLPLLQPALADRVRDFERALTAQIERHVAAFEGFLAANRHLPRREFAALAMKTFDKRLAGIAFKALEGEEVRDAVRAFLLNNARTQAKVDAIRDLFGFEWSTEGLDPPGPEAATGDDRLE